MLMLVRPAETDNGKALSEPKSEEVSKPAAALIEPAKTEVSVPAAEETAKAPEKLPPYKRLKTFPLPKLHRRPNLKKKKKSSLCFR